MHGNTETTYQYERGIISYLKESKSKTEAT